MTEEGLRAAVALFMKAHGIKYKFYGAGVHLDRAQWDVCIMTDYPPPFAVGDFKELLQAYCETQMLATSITTAQFYVNLQR